MAESVTVMIKAANQSVPDLQILCDAGWTVSHLKNHLSSVHPAKPRVDEQRLIYSGQLLADNLLLRSILRHPTAENNAYTIHLVCSPPRHTPANTNSQTSSQRQSPEPPPTSSANQRHSPEPPATNNRPAAPVSTNQSAGEMTGATLEGNSAPPPPPPHSDTSNTNESTDGIRRRLINSDVTGQSVVDAASAYPTQQFPFTALQAAASSTGAVDQVAAMHQMYANYMAYIQYMQMGGVMTGLAWPQQMVQFPTTTATATTTATSLPPPTAAPPQPDAVEAPQPQLDPIQPVEPQAPQQPPQIRMNAQGGEVDDDEDDDGMGRDWLDWIYVLSRMMVLLSIVYFYSTLSRFMVVVCIAMLLYLYQAGWFRPARRIDEPAPPPVVPVPDDQNNNNNDRPATPDDDDNPEAVAEGEGGDNDNNDAPPTPPPSERVVVEDVPIRPSILALSWTFLTTFFTSLIPEQPQVI